MKKLLILYSIYLLSLNVFAAKVAPPKSQLPEITYYAMLDYCEKAAISFYDLYPNKPEIKTIDKILIEEADAVEIRIMYLKNYNAKKLSHFCTYKIVNDRWTMVSEHFAD